MNKLVWYILGIFGIPAIIGYFLGRFFETLGYSKVVSYIPILLICFGVSWVLLNIVLKKSIQEIKVLESEIKQLIFETNKEKQTLSSDLKSE